MTGVFWQVCCEHFFVLETELLFMPFLPEITETLRTEAEKFQEFYSQTTEI